MSISENLFQAIDTIVSQRLNEVSFDRTLICEVVAADRADQGEYTVVEGSNKFIAYNANPQGMKYLLGQQVYVTIPQGDYNLKKVIVGAYTADSVNPYQYASPLEAMLVMDSFECVGTSIDANREENEISIGSWTLNIPTYTEQFGVPKYLGFEGVFTTLLANTTEGNYGIAIKLDGQVSAVFDSDEFLGNPYWYDGGFKLQKVFTFEKLQDVKKIDIILYQRGNFNNVDNDDSISLTNAKLYLGYEQQEFAEAIKNAKAAFTIYESKLLDQEYRGGQDNNIEIHAAYIKKVNGRYEKQEVLDNVEWFRYRAGSQDLGAGIGWSLLGKVDINQDYTNYYTKIRLLEIYLEELQSQEKPTDPEELLKLEIEIAEAKLNLTLAEFSLEMVQNNNGVTFLEPITLSPFTNSNDFLLGGTFGQDEYGNYRTEAFTFPDVSLATERILAKYEGLTSNVLEYTLAKDQVASRDEAGDSVQNTPTIILKMINDDYNGIYNLYGTDGRLVSISDSALRTIEASYDSLVPWGQNGEMVKWYFPTSGTMITPPTLLELNGPDEEGSNMAKDKPWAIDTETDSRYIIYSRSTKTEQGEDKAIPSNRMVFHLGQSYTATWTNNIIRCETQRSTESPQFGEIQLLFGLANTAGTNYSFNIKRSKEFLTTSEGDTITAEVTLQDSTGKYITNLVNPEDVEWSWYQTGAHDSKGSAEAWFNIIIDGDAQPSSSEDSVAITVTLSEVKYTIGNRKITHTEYYKDSKLNGKLTIIQETYTQPINWPSTESWNYKNKTYFKWYGKQITIQNKIYINDTDVTSLFPAEPDVFQNYCILQVRLANWANETTQTNINLIDYFPIGLTNIPDAVRIEGATRIVYDALGTTASYDKNFYHIYNSSNEIINDTEENRWSLIVKNKNGTTPSLQKVLQQQDDGSKAFQGYVLQPLALKPTSPSACYIRGRDSLSRQWQHPILITQNTYASDLLNNWDTSLKIDTEGNSILSALIGAGTKNDENKFTGVLMGTVGDTILGSKTGLYGLKEGARVFELNEDGEFYVGTGANNHISFVNEELNIEVNKFKLSTSKLLIDSSASASDADPVIKFDNKFYLNADGTAKIGGWFVESNKLYSKPNSYGVGMYSGEEGGSPAFWAGYFGTGNHPWSLGGATDENGIFVWTRQTNFYVTQQGEMHAKEAHISGNSVFSGKIDIEGGATIKGKIKAENIEADALTVDTISVTKITGGENTANMIFKGSITCNNLTASTKGKIANWNFDTNSLYYGSSTAPTALLAPNGWDGALNIGTNSVDKLAIKAGSKFGVTKDGELYATNATIAGTVKAGSILLASNSKTRTQLGGLELATLTFTITHGIHEGLMYTVSGLLSQEYRGSLGDSTVRERLLIGGTGFYTFSGTNITIDENGNVTVEGNGAAIQQLTFESLKS